MTSDTIYVGFDPREADGFAVTRNSIVRRLTQPIPVRGVLLADLIANGVYHRPTERRNGRLWDVISDAPMSTEFAISRFIPLRLTAGWSVFLDADMLARASLARLFELRDPSKAVMVVKHDHQPLECNKMDGQIQTRYARKNWSSVMLFNGDHPSNKRLSLQDINTLAGRDLHRFCWLEDNEIGELPPEWNHLVGVSDPDPNAKLVHFTEGVPSMRGYENCPFADEWRAELLRWAR